MGLVVKQLKVGGFDHNFSYLIYDKNTSEAALVDPTGDIGVTLATIQDEHLSLKSILVTHTHFDHIDGIDAIIKIYGSLPIYVHERGLELMPEYDNIKPVKDYDDIPIGQQTVRVIYTPGHIDDAVCFYIANERAAEGIPQIITGDTLFVGGCGRTSVTRVKDLYESLQELKALPSETVIYPGHDYGITPTSTIGYELAHNKYYLAKDFNEFRQLRLAE